jgi:hypothetical protein
MRGNGSGALLPPVPAPFSTGAEAIRSIRHQERGSQVTALGVSFPSWQVYRSGGPEQHHRQKQERISIMILVRVTFQAQFGKAGEIVEIMKQNPPPDVRGRILTDLSGPFDTVVLESVVESIDDYFRQMREMFANEEMSEEMRSVYGLVASGTREFYTIEAET